MFRSNQPLLTDIFDLHGKWRAGDDAVICGEVTWTWEEFSSSVYRLANALLDLGIEPGDRVGLLMSNGLPMVQTIFGVIRCGATVVPLNTSVNDAAASAMFNDAQIKALVVTEDFLDRGIEISANLKQSHLRIVDVCRSVADSEQTWLSLETLTAHSEVSAPDVEIPADSIINIIYSSGTTGTPKGIAHDHVGRRDWTYDIALALRYHARARTLLTIGLYSNISWVAMLSTLLVGGAIVVEKQFDAAQCLKSIKDHRITHLAMVPIQFQRLTDELRRSPDADVSSMQAMMSCGSPLREPLKRELFAHFDCGIIELYGLTEGIITTLEPEDAGGRWSSVGRPLLGTDIEIIGNDDEPLKRGEIGEVVSRGRIAMPGYWNRPEADKEATWIDKNGRIWLRSGDIGYVDVEGYLYIVDRKKDMILSGGQNIYPQDLEAVVALHEKVFDVAVIGMVSATWGETPVAILVPEPNVLLEPGEIKDWANRKLGKQQRLADVILVDELPRNPNGKILKRELREAFKGQEYA